MTLALASLGIMQVPGGIVEPLIALSIVWIAIENCVYKQPTKYRFAVIFIFGLLHGLGFAAVLNYYGLPKDNFVSLLLAFNIGVELGQLSVLIIAFSIFSIILKKNWQSDHIRIPVSSKSSRNPVIKGITLFHIANSFPSNFGVYPPFGPSTIRLPSAPRLDEYIP